MWFSLVAEEWEEVQLVLLLPPAVLADHDKGIRRILSSVRDSFCAWDTQAEVWLVQDSIQCVKNLQEELRLREIGDQSVSAVEDMDMSPARPRTNPL
jgi:hypothetical protein